MDEKINLLMTEFLNESYPLGRIKENNRFKRGICIEGKNFFIPKDNIAIIGTMFNILELVYSVESDKVANLLKNHYNLKL
jgi:hypothetical protein